MMISEIYDALKEAGASEDKARKAAEVLAAYESRFASIERRLDVLTWIATFNLMIAVATLWKVFST
jgi:hypothetical protein